MSRSWLLILVMVVALAYGTGRLVGAVLVPFAMRHGVPGAIWWGPGAFLIVSMVAGLAAYRYRTIAIDWKRVFTEQRLWESGSLGREWLKRRSRAENRKGW